MSDDNRLVYSTDPKEQKKKPAAQSAPEVVPNQHCIKLRLETKSRGGKAVSVLYDLPKNKSHSKSLLKELKSHCACGGSFKEDNNTLEIQGDQRLKIKSFLEKKGFKVKGA